MRVSSIRFGMFVAVALGLDGTGLDDDQDLWRELRLAQVLQGGIGLESSISTGRLFDAGLVTVQAVLLVKGYRRAAK